MLLTVPVLLAFTASGFLNSRPFATHVNSAESIVAPPATASVKTLASEVPQVLTEESIKHSARLTPENNDRRAEDPVALAVAWKFGSDNKQTDKKNASDNLSFADSRVIPVVHAQLNPSQAEELPPTSAEGRRKRVSDQDTESEDQPVTETPEEPVESARPYALQFSVPEDVDIAVEKNRITLTAQNAALSSVLSLVAKQMNLNVICSDVGDERVNVKVTNVPLSSVLDSILPIHGYTHVVQNNIILVTKVDPDKPMHSSLQGKEIRIFDLNYVSGTEVLRIVTKLLSPIGSAFVNQAMPDNKLQSHEQVVVEDMPQYVSKVEEYLAQVDVPPRQVQVEAHILQIALTDNCRHGVDFNQLLRVANSDIRLQSTGFATTTNPTSVFRLNGTDLTSVVDVLKSTTDTKTLASPKVTVINGQKSRMQVGGQIGYLMTTTTQTSSLQSVQFLEYGVILTVTPLITVEGDILMNVKPQVSTGRINSITNLPESETTEVETTVMLKSGEAIIIGGLIKETDTETQNKIPVLGDMWLVGRMFQKRSRQKERSEVVITLLPRIVSEFTPDCNPDASQIDQSMTPLMHGALESNDRTMWEPQLPDSTRRKEKTD